MDDVMTICEIARAFRRSPDTIYDGKVHRYLMQLPHTRPNPHAPARGRNGNRWAAGPVMRAVRVAESCRIGVAAAIRGSGAIERGEI